MRFLSLFTRNVKKDRRTRCVCETQISPQRPIFRKLCSGYLILTLTDGLDFVTKEGILPQGIYMSNMKAYLSKAMAIVNVFADKQTDRPKTICPRSIDVVT